MFLVLLGPIGRGKGAQPALSAQRRKVTHLATGNLLREAVALQTPAGKEAEPFMASGQLVPDDLVNRLVADRFHRPDRPTRFVMDGYPRTAAQAVFFDDLLTPLGLPLNAVLE